MLRANQQQFLQDRPWSITLESANYCSVNTAMQTLYFLLLNFGLKYIKILSVAQQCFMANICWQQQ